MRSIWVDEQLVCQRHTANPSFSAKSQLQENLGLRSNFKSLFASSQSNYCSVFPFGQNYTILLVPPLPQKSIFFGDPNELACAIN